MVSFLAMFAAGKKYKTEDGIQFPAEAYAYVPDPAKPSTWKIRLWEDLTKKETAGQVGRAAAAFSAGGFRGNKAEIPTAAVAAVKRKVRAAWKRTNPDKAESEMPESVKMAAQFSVVDEEDPDIIWHHGLVFRAGDYPDQKYSMTPDELAAAVEAFEPVDFDVQHKNTVFDGKLGQLVSVETTDDNTEMWGTWGTPRWLPEVLGPDQPLTVSAQWNRASKRLEKLGLVVEPQVEDAVMMASFAADPADFAKRHDTYQGRNVLQDIHDTAARYGAVCQPPASSGDSADMASQHEQEAVQAIHDQAVEHGATCSAMGSRGSGYYGSAMYSAGPPIVTGDAPGSATTAREEGTMATLGEMICNALGLNANTPVPDSTAPAAGAAAPAAVVAAPPAAAAAGSTNPQADPGTAALMARNQELEARLSRMTADQITSEAAAFAKEMITAHRVFPVEEKALIAQYVQASTDDLRLGAASVTFGTDGKEVKVTRVDLLRNQVMSRPENQLDGERIPANLAELVNFAGSTRPRRPEEGTDPESISALLEKTPYGAAVVRERTTGARQ